MRYVILFGLLLLTYGCSLQSEKSAAAEASSPFEQELDRFIEEISSEYAIGGGIGIGIVKNGEVIVEKAYGYRNQAQELPVTTTTPFYIASMTKSFMGTLATLLHESQEINIEEPLSSHLPFTLPNDIDLSTKTVEDLFTHTSGIGNPAVGVKTAYTGNFTEEEIVNDLQNLSYPISQGYQYSNLGYIISSITFKKKLNTSWKDLLKTRVFDPLGMKNTSAYVSDFEESQMALPHSLSMGKINTGSFLKKDDTMHAAGGMFTTVEDMNKWMNFHLNQGPDILSSEAFDYIHTDLVGFYEKYGSFNCYGYGMGWNQADWNEYDISWHGGGYPGYRSLCILSREEGLGITIMMNQSSPAITLLADYLLGSFLETADFEDFLSRRKKSILNHQKRYQFVRDSILSAGSKKYEFTRMLSQYEGAYLSDELGEIIIKSDSESLRVLAGNLSFSGNYLGDDQFFVFSDGDQLFGTMDFYFHDSEDPSRATSIDFSGTEYKKVR